MDRSGCRNLAEENRESTNDFITFIAMVRHSLGLARRGTGGRAVAVRCECASHDRQRSKHVTCHCCAGGKTVDDQDQRHLGYDCRQWTCTTIYRG